MELNSILFPGPPKDYPECFKEASAPYTIFIPRNALTDEMVFEKKEEV